jgi:hypothetical protein
MTDSNKKGFLLSSQGIDPTSSSLCPSLATFYLFYSSNFQKVISHQARSHFRIVQLKSPKTTGSKIKLPALTNIPLTGDKPPQWTTVSTSMSEITYNLDKVPTESQCLCEICSDFLLHCQFENYFLTHSKTSFKQLMLISFSV